MNNRRKGSYLSVCFEVRDNSWILEEGWIGEGGTERARIKEFDDTLYANLSAQYATELANSGWEEFRTVVAEAVLPRLSRNQHLHADHLGAEFWTRIEMLFHASVTCALLEDFSVPYGELRRSLLDELRAACVEDEDPWTSTVHVLLMKTSLAVRIVLPAGEVPLVFGSAMQASAVSVDWSIALPRATRLTYVLDQELADSDDPDFFL